MVATAHELLPTLFPTCVQTTHQDLRTLQPTTPSCMVRQDLRVEDTLTFEVRIPRPIAPAVKPPTRHAPAMAPSRVRSEVNR